MLNIQIRPITKWPGTETKYPENSRFQATYKQTLVQLEKEIEMIGADNSSIIIEMRINPGQLTLDGTRLRHDARPDKPGIILSFNRHKHSAVDGKTSVQTLSYPCDAFTTWQDNLRAITLSLESLRRVERYGVFKYDDIVNRLALPPAGEVSTRESAAAFMAQHSGVAMKEILFSDTARSTAYRKAAAKLHPDAGGEPEEFVKLAEANKVLTGSH